VMRRTLERPDVSGPRVIRAPVIQERSEAT
jgi:hypothetical protein